MKRKLTEIVYKALLGIAGITVCSLLGARLVNAQLLIDHSGGFRGQADLTVNANNPGNGVIGNVLRLTNGMNDHNTSVFSTNQVDVSGFTTSFWFEIQPGTAPMADGMMFVVQHDPRGAMARGCGGGGLGYGADSPTGVCADKITNSVGIKFDIFANDSIPCETTNNSTGLFVDGDSPTCADPSQPEEQYVSLDGTGIDLNGQQPLRADLMYDGTMLSETLTNLVTGATFTHSYPVNIAAHVMGTTAWVGFTGATGGLTSIDYVQGWTYCGSSGCP